MRIHQTASLERHPKLCHAKVGQCIRVYDEMTPHGGPLMMVCAKPLAKGVNPKGGLTPNMGLYDDRRELFLVDLASGDLVKPPHLSSRVEIVKDAQVYVGKQLSKALREEELPRD